MLQFCAVWCSGVEGRGEGLCCSACLADALRQSFGVTRSIFRGGFRMTFRNWCLWGTLHSAANTMDRQRLKCGLDKVPPEGPRCDGSPCPSAR